MRYPSLVRVVRTYLSSLMQADSSTAAIAFMAMQRIAAQRERVEEGLSSLVLDYIAAHERGDKESEQALLGRLAEAVRVHRE